MRSNRDLLSMVGKIDTIQKMVALPTITLAAQEADRFIEYVWDESKLKNHARLVRMASSTKNIRGLGIGTDRILKPSATFSSSDYKKTYTENLIQLTSKELRCCLVIFDSDLEDINVGNAAQLKNHIMSMGTKKIANELDEIYWIGDTQSLSSFASDDARSQIDGWRYRLDHSQSGETYENSVTGSTIILDASNTVTAKAADFDLTTSQGIEEQDTSAPYNQEFKFDLMIEKLPSKYKLGGLSSLRFFLNDQVAQRYVRALSKRATPIGDAAIQGKVPLSYGTIPIVTLPLMPTQMIINTSDAQKENLDTSTPGDLTDCVLTHEANFIIGVQKEIQMEAERSAADRANYFFFTLRVDVAIENVNAVVLLKRLKVA